MSEKITNQDERYQETLEELRRTRLLLKASLESSPDTIVFSVDKDCRYLFFNNTHKNRMKHAYGTDISVGMNILDCVTEKSDKEELRVHHVRALAGEGHSSIDVSGAPVCATYESFFNPFFDENGSVMGVTVIARDISAVMRAEKKLRKSEENLQRLVQHLNAGVVVHASDSRILMANNQASILLGLSIEQMTGKKAVDPAWCFLREDGTPMPVEEYPISRVLATRSSMCNMPVGVKRPATNDTVWVLASAFLELEPDGQVRQVIMTFLDITARKQAEEAFRNSQKHLEVAADNVDGVLYALDKDLKFTLSKGRKLSAIRFKPDEIVGRSMYDYFQTNDPRHPRISLHLRALKGETIKIETTHQPATFSTTISPIKNTQGKVVGILGLVLDISEQKKSELALAAETERLAVTLRSIRDGVITTDTNGTVVLINKAAEEMTGWRSEEAVGRQLSDVLNIIDELTRQPSENPVAKVLASGEILELASGTSLISKDGIEIIVANSASPIKDSNGETTGVVFVFRDITEKQKIQNSIQRASKLDSLGVLAGGIAHDFNNLLGGMFGYVDMAKEHLDNNKPEKARSDLVKAFSVYDRTKSLTQRLLTFAKGGAPIRKTVDLTPLIEDSTQFSLSGSNVTGVFETEKDLWPCDCDENQIGQVINNIVINAKQATPQGGKIFVTANNVCVDPDQASEGQSAGNYIKISIKDHGIGIPKEFLPQIYDPFFSTKAMGHGLGLATTYSIIKRHGGWIDVESQPGRGSTFHAFLPASQMFPSTRQIEKTETFKGNGTVLIMDDEDFIRSIERSMLEGMGYGVKAVKDGAEAVALFSESHASGKDFILTILDLTIPNGMGGKETVKAIREIDDKAIVIVASGYADDPVMVNPTEYGFTDKIAKPFLKPELAALLELHSKQSS